jgi:hypothetical protein
MKKASKIEISKRIDLLFQIKKIVRFAERTKGEIVSS